MMIKTTGKLTHTMNDGRLTVLLSGEIDHHSAAALRAEADDLIFKLRPDSVALDLSKIDFMDSSGLGFIMGRYTLVRKLRGDFVMLNPNEKVTKIISLTGIERIIKTERNENNEKDSD